MDKVIYDFCKNAEHIYYGTSVISSLKDLKVDIDVKRNEIYRSRRGNDNTYIFDFSLDIGTEGTLSEEIKYMKTIELFYPKMFSWRYDGDHLQAIAEIRIHNETLGIFSRYNGVENFIKHLRKRLVDILKYRDFTTMHYANIVDDKILATGSINTRTNSYVVDIQPTDKPDVIILNSSNKIITNPLPKILNMKFWVREINPDYYKDIPTKRTKKYPLTDDVWDKYPVCIKRIAELPKKGNYNRFLLATFLLGVHNERDAKHQLDLMLSDDERAHMNNGNCKDQWRTIVAKGYPPPSCKTMIEHGFANSIQDCIGLRIIDEENNEVENNDEVDS